MIRMIKNRARIGKRWLVVQGEYRRNSFNGRAVWKTILQISEHDDPSEARRALNDAADKATQRKD